MSLILAISELDTHKLRNPEVVIGQCFSLCELRSKKKKNWIRFERFGSTLRTLRSQKMISQFDFLWKIDFLDWRVFIFEEERAILLSNGYNSETAWQISIQKPSPAHRKPHLESSRHSVQPFVSDKVTRSIGSHFYKYVANVPPKIETIYTHIYLDNVDLRKIPLEQSSTTASFWK